MYLLRRGEVLVLTQGGKPSHYLGEGSFFGEIVLLRPELRRTASVRAVTQCEMYELDVQDFLEVCATPMGHRRCVCRR